MINYKKAPTFLINAALRNTYHYPLWGGGWRFSREVTSNRIMVERQPDDSDPSDDFRIDLQPLSDEQLHQIKAFMYSQGSTSDSKIMSVIESMASANPYHPIKDIVEDLVWDGKDHIAELAKYFTVGRGYGILDNSEVAMFPIYLRKFLIGTMARLYTHEQCPVLTLAGGQGAGKSTFVKWLASPFKKYFSEAALVVDSKDEIIRLGQVFLREMGELGSITRRADVDALKNYLTMSNARVRMPYKRMDTTVNALTCFIATVNPGRGFLTDPTGSRRFWVVSLRNIDYEYRHLNIEQIWAQAHALYTSGEETHELTVDEAQTRTNINRRYTYVSDALTWIRQGITITQERTDFMSEADVYNTLSGIGAPHQSITQSKVFSGLSSIGVRRIQNENGVWGYIGIVDTQGHPQGVPPENIF